MENKHYLLALALAFIGASAFSVSGYAQQKNKEERKEERKEKRAQWYKERALKRAEARAREQEMDSIGFLKAKQAIAAGEWVLQANQITFRNGVMRLVSSGTNFIAVHQETAVIQTAFSNFNLSPGPNGLGGITVQGAVSPITQEKDVNGSVFSSFSVMGGNLSAIVHLWLTVDSRQANAVIYPNFSGNIMQMSGILVPYQDAAIFEGTSP